MLENVCCNAKVIGKPIYIPATIKTTMRCIFKVSIIINGEKGQFTLVAEGELADICACHLSEDRTVDCVYTHRKGDLILKEIVFGPGPNISINTKTKKYLGGDTFGFAEAKQ